MLSKQKENEWVQLSEDLWYFQAKIEISAKIICIPNLMPHFLSLQIIYIWAKTKQQFWSIDFAKTIFLNIFIFARKKTLTEEFPKLKIKSSYV